MVSAKNSARSPLSPLSPGAIDLGLGDQLKRQVAESDEERKKKLLRQAQMMQAYGPATMTLFGNA